MSITHSKNKHASSWRVGFGKWVWGAVLRSAPPSICSFFSVLVDEVDYAPDKQCRANRTNDILHIPTLIYIRKSTLSRTMYITKTMLLKHVQKTKMNGVTGVSLSSSLAKPSPHSGYSVIKI